jgi:hypothetical protein
MGDPAKEPLCTVKELLVFALICVLYCSIIFSLDPEWVAWAAPLVFGGGLYAADPPPASAHLGSPHDVFPIAYLCDALCLLGLVLLPMVSDKRRFSWPWFKATPESGGITRVARFLRSRFTLMARR